MKKLAVLSVLYLGVALFAYLEHCKATGVLEPGSSLVYPLIDNIFHRTIVDITNVSDADAWLQCCMTTHPAGDPNALQSTDFQIKLTPNQPFWWDTSWALRGDGFFIPSFANRKGFLFCEGGQQIKGDAILYTIAGERAFLYNAAPGEAPSRIYFEGFADGFSGISGTLVLTSLQQGKFSVGLQCWNENEQFGSRQAELDQFAQFNLTELNLDIARVGTPKFQCHVDGSPFPLWGVFFENVEGYEWGGLVWREGQ